MLRRWSSVDSPLDASVRLVHDHMLTLMNHTWRRVGGSALAILAGGCTSGDGGPTGQVNLHATAFNAGAAGQSPRLLPLAVAATHTIDPTTFRVKEYVSGPATEVKITIKRIIAEGENGAGSALLFGNEDGSGPGVEITLTNGTVDLAAAGL